MVATVLLTILKQTFHKLNRSTHLTIYWATGDYKILEINLQWNPISESNA